MKTLFTLLTLALIFLVNVLHAQPAIEWQRCLGGTAIEYGRSIQQTSDGGYIVVSGSFSNDGDVSGNHGQEDICVMKLNFSGEIQWQKCLGGSGYDFGYSIQQTPDGGYIISGATESNDGDVSGNHGNYDAWVVKLNSTGTIQWQKCLGGSDFESCVPIQQTPDSGYIIAGATRSNDGDVSGNHGDVDAWVVKLNSTGTIQWQKCLGGTGQEVGIESIQQATDGGYITAGTTRSVDGDVSGNHGNYDIWVVKLNSTGTIQWQKCLGGTDWDHGSSIQQTTDGEYIVAGETSSSNGDVSGNHGNRDLWLVKLNSTGDIQWQKCLGGTGYEGGKSIQQTTDGGYVVLGVTTNSNDGDVSGNHGNGDLWLVKLNSTGDIQWQKCLGGTGYEDGRSFQQTADGGYVVLGVTTNSNDGDVNGNHGSTDAWVIKLSSVITESAATLANPSSFQISPNPAAGSINLKTEAALVGKHYQVFNAQGKAVMSGQISAEEMPLSTEGLPAGIYTILAAGQAARMVKE